MKKLFKAQIIDEDEDKILITIFAYSQESLEEEMGKSKWADHAKFVPQNDGYETKGTVDQFVGVGDEIQNKYQE